MRQVAETGPWPEGAGPVHGLLDQVEARGMSFTPKRGPARLIAAEAFGRPWTNLDRDSDCALPFPYGTG